MDVKGLLSALQSLIVVLDRDRSITYMNDRADAAFGQAGARDAADILALLADQNGRPLDPRLIDESGLSIPVTLRSQTAPFLGGTLNIHPLDDGQLCLELYPSPTHAASPLDPLTGLIERGQMIRLIGQMRRNGDSGALVLIDIDRLKIINDFLGYQVGDRVIHALGHAFRQQIDFDIPISRWSGHEFLALVPQQHCGRLPDIADQFNRIAHRLPLSQEIRLPGGVITLSIGFTRFGDECALDLSETETDVHDELDTHPDPLGRVNAAVFEAKRVGRNRAVDADRLRQPSLYITGGVLEAALHEERIVAAVQPIVDLQSGEIVADESLARLITPDGNIIAAGQFISAASALQIAHRIDHSIIRQTINYCVTSHFSAPRAHFVNISGDFLRRGDMIEETIQMAMNACSCTHPDQQLDRKIKPLVIEITERELVEDTRDALQALTPLIDFGLRLALDDFGSGYSSYRYLLDLPFHFLKIEGDLVRHICTNRKANRIVRHIQAMAADLGLTTVAEFVGDQQTADELAQIGVDWAQGFHFGHPELVNPEYVNEIRRKRAHSLA